MRPTEAGARTKRTRRIPVPYFLLCCLLSGPALAQAPPFHWAYASYFGTGRYSLDGGAETVVLSISPAWTWRDASYDSEGHRSIGFRFRVPISLGASELESLDGLEDLGVDSVNALSVVPGVEIEIPMGERWSLKPLAYLGYGAELKSSERATIFRLGLRSRLTFEFDKTEMQLVNGLERIGYSPRDGSSSTLDLVYAGLDFRRPLANTRLRNAPIAINWHVMYTRYGDALDLDFPSSSFPPASIESEWELGVAFSKQEGRLGVWRLRLDRVGLSYRFGADGEFSGIGLVFRSLFDR